MGVVPRDHSIYLLHRSKEMLCNCVMKMIMLKNICVLIEASRTLSPVVTIYGPLGITKRFGPTIAHLLIGAGVSVGLNLLESLPQP